jgi:hypothetical protein
VRGLSVLSNTQRPSGCRQCLPSSPRHRRPSPVARRPSPLARRSSPVAARPSPLLHRPSLVPYRPSPRPSPVAPRLWLPNSPTRDVATSVSRCRPCRHSRADTSAATTAWQGGGGRSRGCPQSVERLGRCLGDGRSEGARATQDRRGNSRSEGARATGQGGRRRTTTGARNRTRGEEEEGNDDDVAVVGCDSGDER